MLMMNETLIGNCWNALHLDCLQNFMNAHSGEIFNIQRLSSNLETSRRKLVEYRPGEENSTPPFAFQESLNASQLNNIRPAMRELETDLHRVSKIITKCLVRRKDEDGDDVIVERKIVFCKISPDNKLTIKADFDNLNQLNLLKSFVEQHFPGREVPSELRERIELLTTLEKIDTKQKFTQKLKATPVEEWSTIFAEAFALKKINIPGFAADAHSFDWIREQDTEQYNRCVQGIVSEYDLKKGPFRKFFNSSATVVEQLKESSNKSLEERKVILADHFASVIYDQRWELDKPADMQINLSTLLIINESKQIGLRK